MEECKKTVDLCVDQVKNVKIMSSSWWAVVAKFKKCCASFHAAGLPCQSEKSRIQSQSHRKSLVGQCGELTAFSLFNIFWCLWRKHSEAAVTNVSFSHMSKKEKGMIHFKTTLWSTFMYFSGTCPHPADCAVFPSLQISLKNELRLGQMKVKDNRCFCVRLIKTYCFPLSRMYSCFPTTFSEVVDWSASQNTQKLCLRLWDTST